MREGYAEGLLAFDPDAVQDRANFSHPYRLARGREAVWGNDTRTWVGALTVSEGQGTALRAHYAQ